MLVGDWLATRRTCYFMVYHEQDTTERFERRLQKYVLVHAQDRFIGFKAPFIALISTEQHKTLMPW